MSVISMKLISIIGFIDELDSVASACSSSDIFEPDNVDKFFQDANKFSTFSCSDTPSFLINEHK